MKTLLVIAVVVFGAYYLYNHFQNPAVIDAPIYGELRIDMDVGPRKLNMLLFAKMSNEADCRERAERVWKTMIEGCKDCTMQLVDCKPELSARYQQLFDDVPMSLPYLSLTRGSRFERDGRMVIWGITSKEGDQLCEMARSSAKRNYSGTVRCVLSR